MVRDFDGQQINNTAPPFPGGHDLSRIKAATDGEAATLGPMSRRVIQPGRLGMEFLHQRGIQAKLAVAPEQDVREQLADKAAAEVVNRGPAAGPGAAVAALHADRGIFAGSASATLSPDLPVDAGRPLSAATRRFAEPAFGQDFSQTRLHDSPAAQEAAAQLGARAFTHGRDIWLGPHESESDKSLMSHELAHVVQQGQGVIYLRRATWLERRAWLSFFSHPVPRRLLNNYMDDSGAEVRLSQAEMIGCNPIVNLKNSPAFMQEVAKRSAGGTGSITVSGWGGCLTSGTLGNFTINYSGKLTVTAGGGWSFIGMMDFYDYWDFDPKSFGSGSGRPVAAEIKVRVAAAGLPGQPFHVRSVRVPVKQTSADTAATWAGGTPTSVPGPAARSGVDIGAGDVGGGDVGAEVGAQSSEDLNR